MSTWVVKVGSSLLTSGGKGLDYPYIVQLVDQLARLRKNNHKVALVTSGAIAEGSIALTFQPESIGELQAAAAIGQTRLMQAISAQFAKANMVIGQILITHDDVKERQRYLNARSTLNTLFNLGAIPVVNENDTISTEEIRFGNNDIIGGVIANLIDADHFIILTDVGGLYTADPADDPQAQLIVERSCSDAALERMVGGSKSSFARGGMLTKLQGARLAARSGTNTWIVSGADPTVIAQIARGEKVGTKLLAGKKQITSRMRWLAGRQKVAGNLILDSGAVQALGTGKVSLLPVGVTATNGTFSRGALVACVSHQGQQIARGLTNYDSQTIEKIRGHKSDVIAEMLGYPHDHEIIHRDNLVID